MLLFYCTIYLHSILNIKLNVLLFFISLTATEVTFYSLEYCRGETTVMYIVIVAPIETSIYCDIQDTTYNFQSFKNTSDGVCINW